MKTLKFLFLLLLIPVLLFAEDEKSTTTFNFGGYIKADFINTWYMNGDVGEASPLRDFHLPSQIPVGAEDVNHDLDYHVKESRFNFDVKTTILKKEIHGFIEMDFLMSKAGDEKVSNSFNPRLRHAYFEWDRMLIGQTWSTFMVVVVPDEIDFAGAMDGLVFVRQPQIRYKAGSWWFALENPESTVVANMGNAPMVSDADNFPDLIVRKNFGGKWGNWSIAAIGRNLYVKDTKEHSAFGMGVTTGGKLIVGKKGDDVRIIATYGSGLGRYISGGFQAGAATAADGSLKPIQTLNGYVAYNHFWKPQKWSSSFSVAAFNGFHNEDIVAQDISKSSYSISGNLKWDIVPQLRLGLEYMYANRTLLNNVDGAFHRVQFAAKYVFGYHNTIADEKR